MLILLAHLLCAYGENVGDRFESLNVGDAHIVMSGVRSSDPRYEKPAEGNAAGKDHSVNLAQAGYSPKHPKFHWVPNVFPIGNPEWGFHKQWITDAGIGYDNKHLHRRRRYQGLYGTDGKFPLATQFKEDFSNDNRVWCRRTLNRRRRNSGLDKEPMCVQHSMMVNDGGKLRQTPCRWMDCNTWTYNMFRQRVFVACADGEDREDQGDCLAFYRNDQPFSGDLAWKPDTDSIDENDPTTYGADKASLAHLGPSTPVYIVRCLNINEATDDNRRRAYNKVDVVADWVGNIGTTSMLQVKQCEYERALALASEETKILAPPCVLKAPPEEAAKDRAQCESQKNQIVTCPVNTDMAFMFPTGDAETDDGPGPQCMLDDPELWGSAPDGGCKWYSCNTMHFQLYFRREVTGCKDGEDDSKVGVCLGEKTTADGQFMQRCDPEVLSEWEKFDGVADLGERSSLAVVMLLVLLRAMA